MKRRTKRRIFTIVATALLFGSIATATEQNVSKGYVNVNTRLNLRQEASMEAPIVDKLLPGDVVTIISEDSSNEYWKKVVTESGKTGYVYKDYIIAYETETTIDGEEIEPNQTTLISTSVITAEKSSSNRNFNMMRACQSINGLVLKPGEEFNWYGENGVGPATKENGYKQATVISGGKYVDGYGGGVCQVTTALYNCIDQLEIIPTEHYHHSIESSYVEAGMDATVAYPSKNFVFANTKNYSILFKAYTRDGAVYISAYKVLEKK